MAASEITSTEVLAETSDEQGIAVMRQPMQETVRTARE